MHGAGRRAHWCAIGGFLAHPRAGAQVSLDSMPHARSPPRQNARSMLEWDLMEPRFPRGSAPILRMCGAWRQSGRSCSPQSPKTRKIWVLGFGEDETVGQNEVLSLPRRELSAEC